MIYTKHSTIGEKKTLLDAFLLKQGFTSIRRLKLLCFPDYLFFRTHSHKLYREYQGIPRYSIISRKITDQIDDHSNIDELCTLDTIYIVDGVSGLLNAPFFFQLTKKLDISVVGTNLDFTELPKLRYTNISDPEFQPFEPRIVASTKIRRRKNSESQKLESKSVLLPMSSDLFIQKPNTQIDTNSIAIGSVRDLKDFFPSNFDILRLNLGDFVEYSQIFDYTDEITESIMRNRKICILDEIKKIITLFNVQIVLISLYKLAKFFSLTKNSSISLANQILDISNYWNFSNSILIHNVRRMVWKKEPLDKIENFYDSCGYLLFYK